MKKIIKSLLFFSMLSFAMFLSDAVLAADPGPPPPPGTHGAAGDQDPVGAPIDSGLGILVILAGSAGYGSYKLYKAKMAEKVETEKLQR